MINDKQVLAVIPARGGSKRLPGKNIKPICGRPMIAWTIAAAHGSRYVDRAVLSSDDPEIMRVASESGLEAPFERSVELATDTTSSVDVMAHALDSLDQTYDIAVLLQPTSPLRSADDIDSALETMVSRDATSCVTMSRALQSPYWMYSIDEKGRIRNLLSGNALPIPEPPAAYIPNGAFYSVSIPWFHEHRAFYTRDTVAHLMPKERSIDVDTELDFLFAEALLKPDEYP